MDTASVFSICGVSFNSNCISHAGEGAHFSGLFVQCVYQVDQLSDYRRHDDRVLLPPTFANDPRRRLALGCDAQRPNWHAASRVPGHDNRLPCSVFHSGFNLFRATVAGPAKLHLVCRWWCQAPHFGDQRCAGRLTDSNWQEEHQRSLPAYSRWIYRSHHVFLPFYDAVEDIY
ncbi:MAG: hypothetical protein JWS11_2857 [Cypionkella sp.]|nr:hypothetical protein [Cypionkella sp.]